MRNATTAINLDTLDNISFSHIEESNLVGKICIKGIYKKTEVEYKVTLQIGHSKLPKIKLPLDTKETPTPSHFHWKVSKPYL